MCIVVKFVKPIILTTFMVCIMAAYHFIMKNHLPYPQMFPQAPQAILFAPGVWPGLSSPAVCTVSRPVLPPLYPNSACLLSWDWCSC